jgi:ABC-2 type transport system ATP-binding protein
MAVSPTLAPPVHPTTQPANRRSQSVAVRLEKASKKFGSVTALEDVSFEIRTGEIFGLIGPSGCGKTTVAKMLVGLMQPSEGRVLVRGVEPSNFGPGDRQQIGYTPQGFVLYPTLSVQENARFVAGLYGLGWFARRRRVRETLQFLELWPARGRLARDISGGMQRRLSLACALIHSPSLLVVDEPTAGLDPILRNKIWEHLQSLRDRGVTIVVTTQLIDEAAFCDRVALLRAGSLVAVGTPDELRDRALNGERLEIESTELSRADVVALWGVEGVRRVDWDGDHAVMLLVDDAATATPAVTQALADRGVEVDGVRPHPPTFDEVFVALLKRR